VILLISFDGIKSMKSIAAIDPALSSSIWKMERFTGTVFMYMMKDQGL
jgi:hypothetical protein